MADNTLPDNLVFSDVVLDIFIPTFTSESLSLKKSSKHRGLHKLSGSIDVTRGGLDEQRAYIAFINKCRGQSATFELDLPLHFSNDGIVGVVQTTASSGVGAVELQLGATFSGFIRAGSMFTILNDDKTYVVEEDVLAGGIMKFFPAMRLAHPTGTVIEVREPKITARFDVDKQSLSFTDQGQIVTHTIKWEEALK